MCGLRSHSWTKTSWKPALSVHLLCQPHLCVQLLRLDGKAGGVFLSSLHTHQLHLSLGEVGYEARQQHRDGEGVGQRQTHQT